MSILSRKEKHEDTIITQDLDRTMLKLFLQTYMKLLWDKKVVEGLSTNKNQSLPRQCTVNKEKLSTK